MMSPIFGLAHWWGLAVAALLATYNVQVRAVTSPPGGEDEPRSTAFEFETPEAHRDRDESLLAREREAAAGSLGLEANWAIGFVADTLRHLSHAYLNPAERAVGSVATASWRRLVQDDHRPRALSTGWSTLGEQGWGCKEHSPQPEQCDNWDPDDPYLCKAGVYKCGDSGYEMELFSDIKINQIYKPEEPVDFKAKRSVIYGELTGETAKEDLEREEAMAGGGAFNWRIHDVLGKNVSPFCGQYAMLIVGSRPCP